MMFENLVRFLHWVLVLAILVIVCVNVVFELRERELTTIELIEEYIDDRYGNGYYGELLYETDESVCFVLHDKEWFTERKVTINKDYYMHMYTRGS